MGATLAGLRAVAVRAWSNGRLDLAAIEPEDAERALVLWANSPSQPRPATSTTLGGAAWGRRTGCWWRVTSATRTSRGRRRPRTILEHGTEGVLALHSISKRSNLAGLRAGFFAGDPALVDYLRTVRQHAGLWSPDPSRPRSPSPTATTRTSRRSARAITRA